MLNYYLKSIRWDKDLPQRARMIELYTRVYNGAIYDHLEYFYFQERTGGVNGDYIPVNLRQPSVKTNFCKLVTDNSVSLLFGTDHFPKMVCQDDELRKTLEDIIAEYKLNEIMARAATIGSTGSVVVFVKIVEGVLKVEPRNTKYFTPVFDKRYYNKLSKLTEKYKVLGEVLIDQGYKNIEPDKKYWFHREWNTTSEICYFPYLCDDKDAKPKIDPDNTIEHNLGFVPALWIKNLPKILDNDEDGTIYDGTCTFAGAIDTNIEIDYQLSQAGRALKYSADPLLVLKLEDDQMTLQQNMSTTIDAASGAMGGLGSTGGGGRSIVRSASNALVLNKEDEAKLLEIGGEASKAVMEYVRALREYLMETIHGNRSNADKVNAAQSGKAMQAMNQALIWLTDHLRLSYGEGGFLEIIKMIIKMTNQPAKQGVYGIMLDGVIISKLNKNEKITLAWPAWYPNTPEDKVQNANAIKALGEAGTLSRETATRSVASDYDIDDPLVEQNKVDEDIAEFNKLNPKATETKTI